MENHQKKFIEISQELSANEFERVKRFVLGKGDRRTYRNFDNNNPHYDFGSFSVFLGADVGQKNINNDERISDFNQLTIADWDADIIYYEIIIVRVGDVKEGKMWVVEGMKEGKVYLVDVYGKGIDNLKMPLSDYVKSIKQKLENQ